MLAEVTPVLAEVTPVLAEVTPVLAEVTPVLAVVTWDKEMAELQQEELQRAPALATTVRHPILLAATGETPARETPPTTETRRTLQAADTKETRTTRRLDQPVSPTTKTALWQVKLAVT